MSLRTIPDPKKDFRDNGKLLIPSLFGDFRRHINRASRQPDNQKELHAARLTGKKLRYTMEVFAEIFPDEFSQCLGEVKKLVETMGLIHDCDVLVQLLEKHVQKIESQKSVASRDRKSTTQGLKHIIRCRKRTRKRLFTRMMTILKTWQARRFRQRLTVSMK
jgi:hypothetical protein